MSDELVKRLRDQQTKWMTPLLSQAADRIEALEAALEQADELKKILNWYAIQSAILAKPTIDAQWASNRLRHDRGATARDALTAYRQARDAAK